MQVGVMFPFRLQVQKLKCHHWLYSYLVMKYGHGYLSWELFSSLYAMWESIDTERGMVATNTL